MAKKILFIRGLNTYADEQLHLGPIQFGEIAEPLRIRLARADQTLVNVPDIGTGTLTQHIANARLSLQQLDCWHSGESFHLLAHSIGGLIARALALDPEIGARVLSVTGIGSPHHGAQIAEIANELENSQPWIQKLMTVMNYDTRERTAAFTTLSRGAIEEFNHRTPDRAKIRYLSAVCALPRAQQTLPYRILHLRLPDFLRHEESDGMIPASSQRHGELLGAYALDHMMQVGYCLDLRPRIRQHFQREFTRLVDDLIRLYCEFE
jgi:pimeloyl-ACP methyl ester carboxylesterase